MRPIKWISCPICAPKIRTVAEISKIMSFKAVQVEGALDRYLTLDQQGSIIATYVWIDGSGECLRAKSRTLNQLPKDPKELPIWNFDGSSTGQAAGHDSDVLLTAVAIFKDPFLRGDNILVLCECSTPDGTPVASNHRRTCVERMEKVKEHEPWFGIEQEYSLLDPIDDYPYGWPKNGFPAPQGPYYCAVGADRIFGRSVVEAHYRACLFAGIKVAGTNAEVMPGQVSLCVYEIVMKK